MDNTNFHVIHDLHHRHFRCKSDIFGSNNFILEKIVMLLKKLQLILVLALFGLGLAACGDDSDTGSDSAASSSSDAPMAMAADGTLADYDPDVPSMVVEDNGVVSEEEIYKAWPQ
jgi:hypothetical protein